MISFPGDLHSCFLKIFCFFFTFFFSSLLLLSLSLGKWNNSIIISFSFSFFFFYFVFIHSYSFFYTFFLHFILLKNFITHSKPDFLPNVFFLSYLFTYLFLLLPSFKFSIFCFLPLHCHSIISSSFFVLLFLFFFFLFFSFFLVFFLFAFPRSPFLKYEASLNLSQLQ